MENFKTAKLFDAGGDLSQRWFVFYQFISPETGKYYDMHVSLAPTWNSASYPIMTFSISINERFAWSLLMKIENR